MRFFAFIGRVTFAIYFITVGWQAWKQSQTGSQSLVEKYKTHTELLEKRFNFKTPEFLSIQKVSENRHGLWAIASFTSIGFGGQTAAGVPYATFPLALLIIEKIRITHTPEVQTSFKEVLQDCKEWIMDMALVGFCQAIMGTGGGETKKS